MELKKARQEFEARENEDLANNQALID